MAATEYSWGASDAEMVAQPDEEHLRYAAASGRVLHTFNVADFYALHGRFMEEDVTFEDRTDPGRGPLKATPPHGGTRSFGFRREW
jgi:hypothetical protein